MGWLAVARRELWQRHCPQGLISWRYLWPGQDGRIIAHRQIWWQQGEGWPRWLWLAVQGWQWLRWVGWFGPLALWRTLGRRRAQVAEGEGLGLGQQLWRVGRLTLGWCIPPREIYQFNLHHHPERALDYIFTHELPAYHRWRSRPLGLKPASLATLQDKLRLAAQLTPLGIALVPTPHVISRGQAAPLITYLEPGARLFCKTRSGNQGRGAFTVWQQASVAGAAGLRGQGFEGKDLADGAAVEAAWQALCQQDDALIQPCLVNHAALEPLAMAGRAITVRYITAWQQGQICCLSAVLEVPTHRAEHHHQILYSLLPLDPARGRVLPWPHPERLPEAARQAMTPLELRLPQPFHLPHWPALAWASHQAQAEFPDLGAIAWDWVITPSGPVLLEGNTGWGTATPQMIRGGLLG